jgi:hypothetical protein
LDRAQPAPGASAWPARESAAATSGAAAAAASSGEPKRAPSPAAAGAPMPAPSRDASEDGLPVHGSLQVRYRGRKTGDSEDHDGYATLAVDVGDPERHSFTAHVMGRGWIDLGGDDPSDEFFGPDDTFGKGHAILYFAYVDAHGLESVERLRVGRQQIWETPAFLVFDGIRLEPKELGGVRYGAYGGLRSQYYGESTPDDLVGGVWGETRPWDGGRLRLDWMVLEDDERLGNGRNDLLGVDLRQLVGERLTLEGEFTALEGDARDLRLRAHYLEPESDIMLQTTYYTLLETQRQQALEVDPYFAALGEHFPFEQVGVLASKGFGDALNVNVGVDSRWLDDEGDVGEFNHEFERYYLSTVFTELFVEGLELTLTADYWDDDQQDIRTWGADLHQELGAFDASLGSYYSLYKYDLFLATERDDVRTYYTKVRYDHDDSMSMDLALDYEDDDFEEYVTLRLGVRWLF